MKTRPGLILVAFLLVLLAGIALLGWWSARWIDKGVIEGSGGLWWPTRQVLATPHFAQGDPLWRDDNLANTPGTLAQEGCAVACAAMALAHRGVRTDPGSLNRFLTTIPGGYSPRGWIYWEKAAEFDPARTPEFLPHYEDLPSFALIDMNLLRQNPVIARLRLPGEVTHFVLIVGKEGYDYLILDPGEGSRPEAFPLRELGVPVDAIRFYRPAASPAGEVVIDGPAPNLPPSE